MPRFLTLRPRTEEEIRAVERLAHSRTESARAVERARIIWHARALGITEATVRLWLTRFNAGGVDGLKDAPRSGRPPVYDAGEAGEVVAASLTKPDDLGLPFGTWTLDRLTASLHEEKGVAIGRSRIATLLQEEGLRWRTEETWFGERVDPDFAPKRGRSSRSTKRHPRIVS